MRDSILAKQFGTVVEGPTGLKMPEKLARKLEDILKTAPAGAEFSYRRIYKSIDPAGFQLDDGSRTDVSTITTDAVDRDREVVVPKGMDLKTFSGVVTFAHRYDELPLGRSLWVKAAPSGSGLIAKTHYIPKPEGWGADAPWMPDAVLTLMQHGTCRGKSVGFMPLSMRDPTRDEIARRPEMKGARVIDRSALLEYAVAPIPCNPEAQAIAVSKGMLDERGMSLIAQLSDEVDALTKASAEKAIVPFVRPETIAKALAARLAASQPQITELVAKTLADRLAQAMGRP